MEAVSRTSVLLLALSILLLTGMASGKPSAGKTLHEGFLYTDLEPGSHDLELRNGKTIEIELLSENSTHSKILLSGKKYELKSYKKYLRDNADVVSPSRAGQRVLSFTQERILLGGKCARSGYFFDSVKKDKARELAAESRNVEPTEPGSQDTTDSAFFVAGRNPGRLCYPEYSLPGFENPDRENGVKPDPDGDGQYEDVNKDGRVNQKDVEAFRDSYMDDYHYMYYDFNDDGKISLRDIGALSEEISSGDWTRYNYDTSGTITFQGPFDQGISKSLTLRKNGEPREFNVSLIPSRGKLRLVVNGKWLHQLPRDGPRPGQEGPYIPVDENFVASYSSDDDGVNIRANILPIEKAQAPHSSLRIKDKITARTTSNGDYIPYPTEPVMYHFRDKSVNISFSSEDYSNSKIMVNGKTYFNPCSVDKHKEGVINTENRLSVVIKPECDNKFREKIKIEIAAPQNIHSIYPVGNEWRKINTDKEIVLKEGGRYKLDHSIMPSYPPSPRLKMKSVEDDSITLEYQGYRSIISSRTKCRISGEIKLRTGENLKVNRTDYYLRLISTETGPGIHKANLEKVSGRPIEGGTRIAPTKNCKEGGDDGGSDPPGQTNQKFELNEKFNISRDEQGKEYTLKSNPAIDFFIASPGEKGGKQEWYINFDQELGSQYNTRIAEKERTFYGQKGGHWLYFCKYYPDEKNRIKKSYSEFVMRKGKVKIGEACNSIPGREIDYTPGEKIEVNTRDTLKFGENRIKISSFTGEDKQYLAVKNPDQNKWGTVAEQTEDNIRTTNIDLETGKYYLAGCRLEPKKSRAEIIVSPKKDITCPKFTEKTQKPSMEIEDTEITAGGTVEIKVEASADLAEKGYRVRITGPKGENVYNEEFSNSDEEIAYTVDKNSPTGKYTVKLIPRSKGVLDNAVRLIKKLTGEKIPRRNFRVLKTIEPRWKQYCQERDYNTEKVEQSINCLKNEVVPSCFKENPAEDCSRDGENTVARSTCQNLLDYKYSSETQKCTP